CLVLLQYADDLFVCETIALHPLVLSNGPELTSKWIISTGQGQVQCSNNRPYVITHRRHLIDDSLHASSR
ncbi:hypothetical protein, partial [Rhizobium laguerreae]|uniref:hypothetical protein n=1 Tax=Rhizobium laguerreae TaxID=1076926 RepID=UPI001C925543